MPLVDYEGEMARVYVAGRSLPDESLATWMEALGDYLGDCTAPILDLGAGTGRFSMALAETFGVPVVAVEPASAMRAQVRHSDAGPAVWVVAGRAERIPVHDGSVGAVWASQVLHHVDDLVACGKELRRILRPDGPVLVRGSSAEWPGWWSTYFPGMQAAVQASFMTFEQLVDAFGQAGLTVSAQRTIEQVIADNLSELCRRTELRADSGLAMIPDDQFEIGLRRMQADAAADTEHQPVRETLDLVVFQ
jgi:ubiquinone/menaquinone biosynthesis C-methylase UbiE